MEADIVHTVPNSHDIVIRSVSHPNIVKFIGACLELPHIAIITEYVHPGSLRKILDNELIDISEDNILKVSIQLILSRLTSLS
jgi:serine/threonine protein kinase